MEKDIDIYVEGPLSMSVCSPFNRETTTRLVNAKRPSGTKNGWMVSTDPTFATGEPNPCPCEQKPGTHMHYFYDC